MPTGVSKIRPEPINPDNSLKVVYFPSCVSRAMSGPAHQDTLSQDLPQTTRSILKKSGYEII